MLPDKFATPCTSADTVSGVVHDVHQKVFAAFGLPDERQRSEPARPPLRVLVIGDSEALRELLTIVLRNAGHAAQAVSSVAAALRRLDEATFDIVVADVSLGQGYDGLGFARQVAARWPGVGFILATESADEIAPEQLAAAGVDAVLAKPYRGAELRQAVVRVGM